MPAFRGYFTNSQLQAINHCRLYLQVSTLAEIVTVGAMAVTTMAVEGQTTRLSLGSTITTVGHLSRILMVASRSGEVLYNVWRHSTAAIMHLD
jgi:hypothetical protein